MVGSFTTGNDTIMATETIIDKRRVINHRGQPGTYTMTGVAFLRRNNMINGLATGYHIVMTR